MVGLLVITFCFIAMSVIVYKIGVRGLLAIYREMWYRVKDGPNKPIPPKKYNPCVNMQRTARLELEIYGEVVSVDVKDHLDTCKFPHLLTRTPQPRLPNPSRDERR